MFAAHSCLVDNSLKTQHQRPEGRLLERAMKGPPKISGRQLAEMAEMSEGRVRQIVNGYKTEAGMVLPVMAPAETVARLGAALEIPADEFDAADRADVGDILRGETTSGLTEEGDLWLMDMDVHRVALLEWLEAGVESDPPDGPLLLWNMDALLNAVARKHREETAFLNTLVTMFRAKSKGGDGNADDTGSTASTNQADYGLAANETDELQQPPGEPED